jgi:hypothetical protein
MIAKKRCIYVWAISLSLITINIHPSEKPTKIRNPYSPSNFIGKYLTISGIGTALNISGITLIKSKVPGDKTLGKCGIAIGMCFLTFAYREYRHDKELMKLYSTR